MSYAISPPNKLCASEGATCYGIHRLVCSSLFAVIMACGRTRVGPTLSAEILQWSWRELVQRHEPANQSVKHLNLNATDVSDSRACNVLHVSSFYLTRFRFHSHLNTSGTFGTPVRFSTTPVQSDRPLCDLTRNRANGRAQRAANALGRSEWENKGGSRCF